MKVFYNNKGKVCGWLKDGVYRKEVDSRKHKMKIYNGYGISQDIVHELWQLKCEKIRIKETDTGKVWETSFNTFIGEHSKLANFDGEQRFLPMNHWTLSEDATLKLF